MAAVTTRAVSAGGSGQSTDMADGVASDGASACDTPGPVQPATSVPERTGRSVTTLNLPDPPLPEAPLPNSHVPAHVPAGRGADNRPPRRDLSEPGPSKENVAASPLAVQWMPVVRAGFVRRPQGADPIVRLDARPVGFSPIGDVLPSSLTEVLTRGSHAIRSTRQVEELRRERSGAIATHLDRQIAEFLAICTAENLAPTLVLRTIADRPAWLARGLRRRRPQSDIPESTKPSGGRSAQPSGSTDARGRRHSRRVPPQAWPVLYWRNEMFPFTGRCLHLFIDTNGRTFEGREDPGPLHALGREVRAWPVDIHTVVGAMAEVDARRCAHQLVYGMAHLLWQAGIGL